MLGWQSGLQNESSCRRRESTTQVSPGVNVKPTNSASSFGKTHHTVSVVPITGFRVARLIAVVVAKLEAM